MATGTVPDLSLRPRDQPWDSGMIAPTALSFRRIYTTCAVTSRA